MTAGLRIVIVEDDAFVAMDLADLLIGQGHDVRAIARTEIEAVTAAAQHQPELMIVDGHLAEGSGVFAMRQIVAQRFVPHFYVTGDPLELRRLEPDAVIIAKPFNLRELTAAIERVRRKPCESAGSGEY